ncbi:vancomycin resistance protein [Romboutsia maritimum]|uniref:Vancomycin resistance protein n=1 Tax=Romboutsia maritimum TaxID=2020948 RepID=A0A371ITV2_9FIRM|nr:VanW family protein [Romboutsia maritimum]RDY23910.1 vancomycin resistance protein [Romboutsia maritimum]
MSESKKSKRVERTKKAKRKNLIVAGSGIVLLGGLFINYFNKNYIYNNQISKNIFIEDLDVSKMTKDDAIKNLNSKYNPKNINLSYDEKTYEIKPKDIDLRYNTEEIVSQAYNYTKTDSYFENVKRVLDLRGNKKEFEIKSLYDEAKLSKFIENVSNEINLPVKNAKVNVSDGDSVSVTPSRQGKEFDVAANKESIYKMINSKTFGKIDLKVNIKQPNVTTAQAKTVDTLLAEFTTKFTMAPEGRANNIMLAANKGSNVLLMPGEEYSYNALTGPRTKSNGYKDAPVIIKGKLEDASGGGVCQTSSTIYNVALFSGMQITAVSNHTVASNYVPMGQDAMVNDGGTDFRFKNPYNHPVYVKNISGNGFVTSRIYGNSADKKNINLKVDKFKENGLDATKTYRLYKDSAGNIINTEYIAKSVYKKLIK